MDIKFIADNNVGKLARWLRLIGYDTVLLKQKDDAQMIVIALVENRVILTKDAQFMKRRVVANGTLKAMHIEQDNPGVQVQDVLETLSLDCNFKPFSRCLECNQALIARGKEDVKDLIPGRVCETQAQYTQCPACHRIYWRGTHWEAMGKKLKDLQTGARRNPASA